MRTCLALAGALLVLTACSGGDDVDADEAFERTCGLVRSGVAAFNEDQYDTTVEKFQSALDPARENDRARDDAQSAALLEAVEYYADLPPDQYREAFTDSPDFKRHQATTLGQCGDAQPEDSPGDEAQT